MANIFQRIRKNKTLNNKYFQAIVGIFCIATIWFIAIRSISYSGLLSRNYDSTAPKVESAVVDALPATSTVPAAPVVPVLDKVAYDAKMLQLANIPPVKIATSSVKTGTSTTATSTATSTKPVIKPVVPSLWPAKTVYPLGGALLPFNRIVAYYGNFYSSQMGILGQYPPAEMLQKLQAAAAEWKAADPTTPVIPAIDYIAVTAQSSPGADGKYRARMPADQIQKAIALAAQVNGIVILDVQVGQSDVQTEIPLLEQYLKLPQVELALDPEFSMKTGKRPGTIIGTMDATDINYTANYLASLVKLYNLPPKVLVVHRFTEHMVTNYQNITPLPEVEVVMDMDGWSTPAKKINIYNEVIKPEPVQFTGIKLFYKTDLVEPVHALLTPAQILQLQPQPSFIQYQ